jgi:hypothetical protein
MGCQQSRNALPKYTIIDETFKNDKVLSTPVMNVNLNSEDVCCHDQNDSNDDDSNDDDSNDDDSNDDDSNDDDSNDDDSNDDDSNNDDFIELGTEALREGVTKLVGHGTNMSVCSTDANAAVALLLEAHRLLILGGFPHEGCSSLLCVPELMIVDARLRVGACQTAVRTSMAILSAVLRWGRESKSKVEFLPQTGRFLPNIAANVDNSARSDMTA